MFRRKSIGAWNPEWATDGDAVVAGARLVVGKVMKGDISTPFCIVTSEQTFTGLLIQTDGNIVASGELDGDLAVARYLAN